MTETNNQTIERNTPGGRRGRMAGRLGLSVGGLMLVAGLVVLASVAWQLWGTGIATARAQHRLGQQFNTALATGARTSTAGRAAAADVVPTPASTQPSPPVGTAIAHLIIPDIGVNDYVVEGVGTAQLAEGPGHYPGTASIGGDGNVGIAGHRTTYGAPFYDLNELRPGDPIYLTTAAGKSFTYRVTSQFVVSPSDGAVLNPTPTPTLTLTTCNPRYSSTQRLIVRANLDPGATAA